MKDGEGHNDHLERAAREVVREDALEGLVVDVERERALLERDVALLELPHHSDLDGQPALVPDGEARHVHELVVLGVVVVALDALRLQPVAAPLELDLGLAVLLRVDDLLQDLALLGGVERRVGVLAELEELLVAEVRAAEARDDLGRRAHLGVRAPDLPRAAEALQAQHGLVRDPVGAEVLEHPEEGLQHDDVLQDLVLALGVEGLDDLEVGEEEERLADAVLVLVDAHLGEQQLRPLGDRPRAQRRRVVRADLVVAEEVLERAAHVEARLADLRHLERARVGELLEHEVVVPVARLERLVGLEAADVVVLRRACWFSQVRWGQRRVRSGGRTGRRAGREERGEKGRGRGG